MKEVKFVAMESHKEVEGVTLDNMMVDKKFDLLSMLGGKNEVQLIGRLAENPERLKSTANGKPCYSCPMVAVSHYIDKRGQKHEQTTMVPLQFRFNFDSISKARKGDSIIVTGQIYSFPVVLQDKSSVYSFCINVKDYYVDFSSQVRKEVRNYFSENNNVPQLEQMSQEELLEYAKNMQSIMQQGADAQLNSGNVQQGSNSYGNRRNVPEKNDFQGSYGNVPKQDENLQEDYSDIYGENISSKNKEAQGPLSNNKKSRFTKKAEEMVDNFNF